MQCNFFVCESCKNNICDYSGDYCTSSTCSSYANCFYCSYSECSFKEMFLGRYKEAIEIQAIHEKKKEKETTRQEHLSSRVYAVRKGRHTGLFNSWEECRKAIEGFKNPEYRFFYDRLQAEAWLNEKREIHSIEEIPYAYVDGSYNQHTNTYGYGGFIYDGERHSIQGSGTDPEMSSMRNVAGEILGAIAAIQYAIDNNLKELIIYYDYTGIEAWATGKWSAYKKGTQYYKRFCEECNVKLIFKKIKSHSGILGNEYADLLAKKAVGL